LPFSAERRIYCENVWNILERLIDLNCWFLC
jgi:hypothetical protein